MVIVITGGTGFIGKKLRECFPSPLHSLRVFGRKMPAAADLEGADAVIHLAGEPVAQRWTGAVKQRILASRVQGTRELVTLLKGLKTRPRVLLSASAIGFYGDRKDQKLAESAVPGTGFLADVCVQWERAAQEAEQLGIRVVNPRIGIVLGKGGALEKMLPPFRMGVGGRLGEGGQWMSWIHIDDLAGLFRLAMDTPAIRGPLNVVAPNAVTNAEFTAQLAHVLSRPAIFPVPPFALKLLFGEMAEVLLTGQRVLPEKAQSAGYSFRYPELTPALRSIVG